MLDKLSNQLNQVVLAMKRALLERLKGGHLLGDVILLQRHQLKSKEFSHILGQQGLSLELTWIHGLNYIQLVDFVLRVG